MTIRLATLSGVALFLAVPAAAEAPDPVALVDARAADTARVARQIWEWAEVGYKEEKSSALLSSELQKAGFKVTKGVAGIPTAFTAEWGSGGPLIGVLGEYDALPGISQDAVPDRSVLEGKAAAHACGHNLFGAGSVTAAIAIKKWLEASGTPGRIRFYGTPAEEGGSGKVYMVRDGLFDDVDFAIHWHADDENSAAARTSLANRSAKFRFKGKSAHAAGAPEQGRSALDGVEAMNMMVNMMREHTTMDSRIHYVITEGGSAPNVIPDSAEVFYYVRHSRTDEVEAMWTRLEAAAKGAAMGTGTEVSWEVIHGNNPLLVNETMARMMDTELRKVGGVDYTADERAFAGKLAPTLARAKALETAQLVQPYEKALGYGSTDVGDVSWATPTVGVRTATWVPGTPSHSWQSAAASGTTIGFKGAQVAAKAMTLAAIRLYTDPALRDAAKAEFDAARGPGYTYKSLLGDRKPPLDYRD
ncbi:p-aminobenzoyl-glutamate hydrolase subunit B [Tsuneonella dongtanensis]|uniref:p-aminobenzoyl-glutamate hydrolase subunit B n=1 Tax=Tsuneonella dongtanensis TaxID=692370 RepID=A0A1B2A9G9_9SPHN|nr:amidohydrolase [Tsuneonella dongtanensis]ANY18823.1 p-aminobenzoyl-glutamate hydrolase subunit B [Tsuneonella dongtanensis]